MKWPSKYTKADYQPGTTRLRRSFAFLPVNVNSTVVWLCYYEILEMYSTVVYQAVLDPEKPKEFTSFKISSWVEISKRLMK